MENPFSMLSELITKPFANEEMSNDEEILTDSMIRTMEFEGGHREKAYLDTEGYPTIGFGHVLDTLKYDALPEKYKEMHWDKEEGQGTFLEDYLEKEKRTARKFGKEDFEGLPEDAQTILVDLVFNMGAKKLFTKFPGFIKDMKAGDFSEAAKELRYKNPDKGNMDMSLWWDQVGGDNTEKENLLRSDNRATSTYDMLMNLE